MNNESKIILETINSFIEEQLEEIKRSYPFSCSEIQSEYDEQITVYEDIKEFISKKQFCGCGDEKPFDKELCWICESLKDDDLIS